MLRATKYRIYPTEEQAVFLNNQFGAVRFVWNKALGAKKHFYKFHGINLSPVKDLKPFLSIAKKSRKYSWLSGADSIALQESLRHLQTAFKSFFDSKLNIRFPRFKSKHGKQSSYHCMSVSIGDDWVKIPKCSKIKARIHRPSHGKLKSITVSKTPTGKYYASVLVDDKVEAKEKPLSLNNNDIIGIDLGISHLFTDSNGQKQNNPRFLKLASANLRRKQKSLSRKKKGSKNRVKARLLVAKAHERTAFTRNDFQHKLSKRLIDENQAICVETLKVKNLLKNANLAKHIADASWGELIRKLEYKAKWYSKHFIKIDQWYASSKTCSCCGSEEKKMLLNVRCWECKSCGMKHDRDINAAINIKKQAILMLKAEGLSVSACGGLRKTG